MLSLRTVSPLFLCLWCVCDTACAPAGSQVCNLSWSKNVNEIVSTHGYSQNQIIVWKHPTMTKLATLTGHTLRVLYLAVSPDGQTIVTGAGTLFTARNVLHMLGKPVALLSIASCMLCNAAACTALQESKQHAVQSIATGFLSISGNPCIVSTTRLCKSVSTHFNITAFEHCHTTHNTIASMAMNMACRILMTYMWVW